MKVLSLFDGISCGQIALERNGITFGAREYMKYLKKMVDEWYDNGRKDEQKR